MENKQNRAPLFISECCELKSVCQLQEEAEECSCYELPVVKELHGKWGLLDAHQNVMCPFSYDEIFRIPCTPYFVVIREGKMGCVDNHGELVVPCEMDNIYLPSYLPWPLFFVKGGKWGWYWYDCSGDYKNYQTPFYDEIYFMSEQQWLRMYDDMDEFFEARVGDMIEYILTWTNK